MRHNRVIRTALAVALVSLLAAPAVAGPPLVCRPFDIGGEGSLPWDTTTGSWKGMRGDYEVSRLRGDTMTLLTPSTPVLVRMETLRRAALYASTDEAAARGLLSALLDRARGRNAGALEVFDAGYLVETYKQLRPIAPSTAALAAGIDGYGMVRSTLEARGHDPAMEFAAAMMTVDGGKGAAWAEHARTARAGSAADQLLARNIKQLEH
jgi:hypothetical protein